MDDFIRLAIPTSHQQLDYVATAIMTEIHDVFPAANTDAEGPISHEKLLRHDGQWAVIKDILSLTFNGNDKTIWLSAEKGDAILATLKWWIRIGSKRVGIQFSDFQSTLAKLQHAFITIPAGRGLLSFFYAVLALQPMFVFLHRNTHLQMAIMDCRTILRESIAQPM
jgi:hypothetical protein